MPTTLDTASFTIIHRDVDDRPDLIYSWDSSEATYLAASINVCRRILDQQKVRHNFKQFAAAFDKTNPAPWYRGRDMKRLANDFIDAVLLDFPLVFVDERLQNPDYLAFSSRRPWDRHFSTHDQWIRINGARVSDMCHVAHRARKARAPNNDAIQQLRGFMFMFANVFMHELGHLFMTYLTQGRADTPAGIYGRASGVTQGATSTRGEAGRYLETLVFGGVLGNYRNDFWGDHQISQESINKTVQHRFDSAYRTTGGVNKNDVPTLGRGHPLPPPAGPGSDPFAWRQTACLMERNPPQRLLLGPGSNLYRMAWEGHNPNLCAEAAEDEDDESEGSEEDDDDQAEGSKTVRREIWMTRQEI